MRKLLGLGKNVEVISLSDLIKESSLPESLRGEFIKLEGPTTSKEIKLFHKVNDFYASTKNILGSSQVKAVEQILVSCIRDKDENDFDLAYNFFRQSERDIQESSEKQQSLQASEIAAAKKKQAQLELKKIVEEKYITLEGVLEETDKDLYQQYVQTDKLAEARNLLTAVEVKITRLNLIKIRLNEKISKFYNTGEEFVYLENTKNYNADLKKAEQIIEVLELRLDTWEQGKINAFNGIKKEYSKFFSKKNLKEITAKFTLLLEGLNNKNKNEVLVSNELETFFNQVKDVIKDEKKLRDGLNAQIDAREALQLELEKFDYSATKERVTDLASQVRELLSLPVLSTDAQIKNLLSKIQSLEAKIDETQQLSANLSLLPKTGLENRFIEMNQRKLALENSYKGLVEEFKENSKRVTDTLSAEFDTSKRNVEESLDNSLTSVRNIKAFKINEAWVMGDSLRLTNSYKILDDSKEKIIKAKKRVSSININGSSLSGIVQKIKEIKSYQQEAEEYNTTVRKIQTDLNDPVKTRCYASIKHILEILLKETEARINKYAGLFGKSKDKKDQAQVLAKTITGLLKAQPQEITLDKVNSLKDQSAKFTTIASKEGFWAKLPGFSHLAYTKNDQAYTDNVKGRLAEITELTKVIQSGLGAK